MAKKTRSVKHYEIYTVIEMVDTKEPIPGDEKHNRIEQVPVAIFDDNDAAKAAVKKVKDRSFEIAPRWVEIEPAQENYSLPFNPKSL